MSLFILDTSGDNDLLQKNDNIVQQNFYDGFQNPSTSTNQSNANENYFKDDGQNIDEGIPLPKRDISDIIEKALSRAYMKEENENNDKDQDESLSAFMANFGSNKNKPKKPSATNIEKEMQNSILRGIEDKKEDPCLSLRKLKKLRKGEREKTKGPEWFNMPATEVTEEIENDLKILQMRSALNPKHFYKKNDLKVLPKYFQVGTVQHSPLDFYSERDTRKNKKKTMVEELLADAEFQKFNKRKYKEVMEKKQRTGYNKAVRKMKKLKKKKT